MSSGQHHDSEGLTRRRNHQLTRSLGPARDSLDDDSQQSGSFKAHTHLRQTLSLPAEDRHRSAVARLWLQSRLIRDETNGEVTYQPRAHDRSLSTDNLRTAFHLAKELRAPFFELLWKEQGWRVILYLARQMVRGTIPAGRIWAQAKMMDLVQQSLETGGAEAATVFRVAGISLAFTTFDTIYDFVSRQSDNRVRTAINHSMDRAYLSAQMSLSIPAISSPYVSALMYEAEVFIGSKPHTTRNGETWNDANGPFQTISHFISAVTCVVELVTQLSLLLNALLGSGSESWGLGRVLLIFFSLGPTILRLGGDWMMGRGRGRRSRGMFTVMRQWQQLERTLRDMGTNGHYKQENVLFGLKDWVLTKWDAVRQARLQEETQVLESNRVKSLGLSLGKSSMETMFYVMLALRITGSTISLGTVRLYQSIATQLTSTLQRFTVVLERAYQTIFYLAAYIEATTNLDATELAVRQGAEGLTSALVDYETMRGDGGLSITARNVQYTYPSASTPALRDISIHIRAGETLAIVGFNGGGKSTLVKILMGLYDHDGTDGELLINGVPVRRIDPVTLHRRTSCLFQNFNRYPLSLRENIGIGSFEHMNDEKMVERAITRGGAEAIKDKVGLEGRLLQGEVTDPEDLVHGAGDIIAMKAGSSEATKAAVAEDTTPSPRGQLGEINGTKSSVLPLGVGTSSSSRDKLPGQRPLPSIDPVASRNGTKGTGAPHGQPKSAASEDRGTGLSGGQWQRVALARAFLRSDEADLVVFDEPSASLDPRAEAALFQRIHALSTAGGKRATTIYISHRFSTVRKADQIAVVEDGTITEVGSHAELMVLGGRYAELFNLQKEGYEE